ncbi:MAG TPA: hypothetical protein VK192_14145 [Sphingomicrobium sp.]|jgi:hypothetical protein|nr:hypothetical protein [Sphingomicrobium sp.]
MGAFLPDCFFFAAGLLEGGFFFVAPFLVAAFDGIGMLMPGIFMDCADTGTLAVSANALAAK